MERNSCASYGRSIKIYDPTPSTITFSVSDGIWTMKIIKDEGVLFNREAFPNATPDDFALAVIEILERNFNVKFEKKE